MRTEGLPDANDRENVHPTPVLHEPSEPARPQHEQSEPLRFGQPPAAEPRTHTDGYDAFARLFDDDPVPGHTPEPPRPAPTPAPEQRTDSPVPQSETPETRPVRHETTPRPEVAARNESDLIHVTGANKPTVPGENGQHGAIANKPDERKVAAALKNQIPQRMVVDSDDGLETRVRVTKDLLPPDAPTAEPVSSREAADETTDPNAVAQLPAWAAIVSKREPDGTSQSDKPGIQSKTEPEPAGQAEPKGIDTGRLTETQSAPYALVVDAAPVTPAEAFSKSMQIRQDLRNASLTRTSDAQLETSRLEARQAALVNGKTLGLGELAVAFGIDNPEEFEQRIESTVRLFPTDGGRSWDAMRDLRGIVKFDSLEDALAASRLSRDAILDGGELAKLAELPSKDITGFSISETTRDYATNIRDLGNGPYINLGRFITNAAEKTYGKSILLPVRSLGMHYLAGGPSGNGKTNGAIVNTGFQIMQENTVRMNNREIDIDGITRFTWLDGEKTGEVADRLASAYKAIPGIPEELKVVDVIVPGGDGLWANIDLLRLTGKANPADQARAVSHILSLRVKNDPIAALMYTKWIGKAIENLFEEVGNDMKLGGSLYQHGVPTKGNMLALTQAITRVINSEEYSGEVKGNVGGYTRSAFDDLMLGTSGWLFQEGRPVNWEKTVKNPTTGFEFGEMDDVGKNMAMMGIFLGYQAALKAALGGKPASEMSNFIVIDEGLALFREGAPAADFNASRFALLRSMGVGLGLSAQTFIGVDKRVTGNARTRMQFGASEEADMQQFAISTGATPEQLKYLAASDQGEFLFFTRGMEAGRPALGKAPNMDEIGTEPGEVRTNSAHLLDPGLYREEYRGGVPTLARRMLLNRRDGNLVHAWAETSAALAAFGRHLPILGEDFRTELASRTDRDALIRNNAVTDAVEAAVDARPETQDFVTRDDFANYLLDDMLAQASGQVFNKPTLDIEKATNLGRFSLLYDEVKDALTAPRLRDTAAYEDSFGPGQKVYGVNAAEQGLKLRQLVRDSISTIANTLDSLPADEPVTEDMLQPAIAAMSRLTNGVSEREINEVRERVQTRLQREFSGHEAGMFGSIVAAAASSPIPLRYSHMMQAIEDSKSAYLNRGPFDLGKWEKRLARELGGSSLRASTGLAQEQLILDAEARFLAREEHRIKEPLSLVFARDLISPDGGIALDNKAAWFTQQREQRSLMLREQRARLNGGKEPKPTFSSTLDDKTKDASRLWAGVLSEEVLLGNNFRFTTGATRFLMQMYSDQSNSLIQDYAKHKSKGEKAS